MFILATYVLFGDVLLLPLTKQRRGRERHVFAFLKEKSLYLTRYLYFVSRPRKHISLPVQDRW